MRETVGFRVRATLGVALLCIAGTPALAQSPTVRVGALNGFGRVTFAFPAATGFHLAQDGDVVTLRFDQSANVPSAGRTRNVLAVRGSPGGAEIEVVPGARIRAISLDSQVIIDVRDPSPKPKGKPEQPHPLSSRPAPVAAPVVAAPEVATVEAVAQQSIQAPLPAAPVEVAPAADVLAVSAAPAPLPPGTPGHGALVLFGRDVGAAAFQRADGNYVVFDERRPIDLQALHDDPAFASATIQLLPAATLLKVDPAPGAQVQLTRQVDGWMVAVGPAKFSTTPIEPVAKDGRMLLPASSPGRVVVVPDGSTGEKLLVGTTRDSGSGMAVSRRTPEFTLAATWQGVLVEPHTDRVDLRVANQGFIIDALGQPLAMSSQPSAARLLSDAAVLTRRFDFPNLPTAALLRRMQNEVVAAGTAPALARFQPRLAAAQTMIALGMGAEAEALLRLAMKEEPGSAADPAAVGLIAIASLLAGRTDQAKGLSDPALSATDEIALWRAVAEAMREGNPAVAAPIFAATLPLVLAYPAALRDRLLPPVVTTMTQGGEAEIADAVLAQFPIEPSLATARALRLAAKGATDQALAVLDSVAIGHDRLAAAGAAAQAIELRLADGALSPSAAADALERQFLAWRGDGRELVLRLRAATLRAQSNAPRAGLALLRETDAIYPEAHTEIRARMSELLTEALAGPAAARITPLDFAALADENADVVAEAMPVKIAGLLADRLVALDLPQRAGPLLDKIMQRAAPGEARAALGLRLASLRLGEADDVGALAALSQSDAPGLTPQVTESRTLLAARVRAHQGDPRAAIEILATLEGSEARQMQAELLAQLGDWAAAAVSMASYVSMTVPEDGPLTPPQQQELLRLASLQSKAGDAAGLQTLGVREGARMSSSPQAAVFAVLTAKPIRETTDLKRSSAEVMLARAIPSNLAAIGAR